MYGIASPRLTKLPLHAVLNTSGGARRGATTPRESLRDPTESFRRKSQGHHRVSSACGSSTPAAGKQICYASSTDDACFFRCTGSDNCFVSSSPFIKPESFAIHAVKLCFHVAGGGSNSYSKKRVKTKMDGIISPRHEQGCLSNIGESFMDRKSPPTSQALAAVACLAGVRMKLTPTPSGMAVPLLNDNSLLAASHICSLFFVPVGPVAF